MKAIVMAGGHGTRMRPLLAPPINKHLMPVGGRTLIEWPLLFLANSGVRDVLILLNGPHAELICETIGTGEHLGLNVFYRYTPETHGASVGRHLLLAQPWVTDEPFLLIIGDSLYFLPEIPNLRSVKATHTWVFKPDDAWDDMSKYAKAPHQFEFLQSGLWFFDQRLFAALTDLADLPELRIRHIIEHLAKDRSLTATLLPPRSFIDCGTPDAVATANRILTHKT
jgi:glucose-1-phosphate thymidylyltransferase